MDSRRILIFVIISILLITYSRCILFKEEIKVQNVPWGRFVSCGWSQDGMKTKIIDIDKRFYVSVKAYTISLRYLILYVYLDVVNGKDISLGYVARYIVKDGINSCGYGFTVPENILDMIRKNKLKVRGIYVKVYGGKYYIHNDVVIYSVDDYKKRFKDGTEVNITYLQLIPVNPKPPQQPIQTPNPIQTPVIPIIVPQQPQQDFATYMLISTIFMSLSMIATAIILAVRR